MSRPPPPCSRLAVPVAEGAKQGKGVTGLGTYQRLGTPLTIKRFGVEEKFEDLDEIQARFVEPVAEYCQQVIRHRKFLSGTESVVETRLFAEKRRPNMENQALYYMSLPEDRMRGRYTCDPYHVPMLRRG